MGSFFICLFLALCHSPVVATVAIDVSANGAIDVSANGAIDVSANGAIENRGVLEATDETWDEALTSSPLVFAAFVAPWFN